MNYFQVRYDFRVVIYERKMFIRLTTAPVLTYPNIPSVVSNTALTALAKSGHTDSTAERRCR